METILDHNMTEEERYKIIGRFSDEDFLYGLDENSSNLFWQSFISWEMMKRKWWNM